MSEVTIKEFIEAVETLPPSITIKCTGRSGIGKTDVCRQIGKKMNKPVVICHMAQYTEADILGLPFKVEVCRPDGTRDFITKFARPDMLYKAMVEPVILVLDELNRAKAETLQVTFPLLLERRLESNDTTLHAETRIIALENVGAEYAVTMFDDRAYADRFWTCKLNPTIDEWLDWGSWPDATRLGKQNIDQIIRTFIAGGSAGNSCLEAPDDASIGSDEKFPSRRAWKRLNDTLTGKTDLLNKPEEGLFFKICSGFIGTAASVTFKTYMQDATKRVSAEECLVNWKKVKDRLGDRLDQNKYIEIALLLHEYVSQTLSDRQVVQLVKLMQDSPPEIFLKIYESISRQNGVNLKVVHPHVKLRLVEVANSDVIQKVSGG